MFLPNNLSISDLKSRPSKSMVKKCYFHRKKLPFWISIEATFINNKAKKPVNRTKTFWTEFMGNIMISKWFSPLYPILINFLMTFDVFYNKNWRLCKFAGLKFIAYFGKPVSYELSLLEWVKALLLWLFCCQIGLEIRLNVLFPPERNCKLISCNLGSKIRFNK